MKIDNINELILEGIETRLAERKIHDPQLVAELFEVADAGSDLKSAKRLGVALNRLPLTPGGEAVARYLLDEQAESIRDSAKRIGCQPSSLSRATKAFLRLIGHKGFVQHLDAKVEK